MVRLQPDDGSRAGRRGATGQKVDRAHDVPYLAGYSLDGKTIYIDRHMPRAFEEAIKELRRRVRRHGTRGTQRGAALLRKPKQA
jgi:hypothetical protein